MVYIYRERERERERDVNYFTGIIGAIRAKVESSEKEKSIGKLKPIAPRQITKKWRELPGAFAQLQMAELSPGTAQGQIT